MGCVVQARLVPFLKWAGGKRQLLPEIVRHLPPIYQRYYEPFVGGGALLFHLKPAVGVINDANPELCNCYQVIRDDLQALLEALAPYKDKNNKEDYYRIRDMDRMDDYHRLTRAERAARILYLNKTCYNGLFRVNCKGFFNVPFGRYTRPRIYDEPLMRSISHYFNTNAIEMRNTDFEDAVSDAGAGDFVYLDPPYDPVSPTASFTGYSRGAFDRLEQIRLYNVFQDLDRRGCKVLLSNSATDFILDLYRAYPAVLVSASRCINSVSKGRGKIHEVLVMNYVV